MTNAPRGREYSILNSQFAERATASDLPLTATNAPLMTPAILDQVFRNIKPMNNGLALGRGLTPFLVVYEGHANAEKLKRDIKKNEIVSMGAAVSLSDTDALTTNNTSLPTEPHIAQEKMMGWSILVDCFHGHTTQIAVNVHAAVAALFPYVHPLVHQVSASLSIGMENLCRVMYELQQDYFAYLHQVAIDAPPPSWCPHSRMWSTRWQWDVSPGSHPRLRWRRRRCGGSGSGSSGLPEQPLA
jgi:hypothetical protein